jgi:alginate O-acetyltransferase complex protein AlgI
MLAAGARGSGQHAIVESALIWAADLLRFFRVFRHCGRLGSIVWDQFTIQFCVEYKSRSVIEFWRRWHITLSRFLRDYLYIPLGGNWNGSAQQRVDLIVTMTLGGLWHGAAWTFVSWGVLHGVNLSANHLSRNLFSLMPTIDRRDALLAARSQKNHASTCYLAAAS